MRRDGRLTVLAKWGPRPGPYPTPGSARSPGHPVARGHPGPPHRAERGLPRVRHRRGPDPVAGGHPDDVIGGTARHDETGREESGASGPVDHRWVPPVLEWRGRVPR